MKLFIDTANVTDIEAALDRGIVRGITTNPSLLAKEPRTSFEAHIGTIVDLLKRKAADMPLSVEVFSSEPAEILRQARQFRERFAYDALSIKIQIGWNELEVIHALSREGFSVNCTACMTVSQAHMAAQAGARYVSLFWGRIKDGGTDERFASERERALQERRLEPDDFDPASVVRRTRDVLDRSGSAAEIIAGSIRGAADIQNAGLAGAHIVTVPPKFFQPMASHYKTDEVIKQFLADFNEWFTTASYL